MAVRKPPPKSAQQLLTEKLMRGGKSRAQYDADQRMRAAAAKKSTTPTKAAAPKPSGMTDAQLREYYAKNGHLPTIFANESKKRFQDADPVDTGKLAADVANGRISREEALRRIREGVAVNDPNKLRVGLDVSAELDPQLNAIERRRKLAKDTLDRTLGQDQQFVDKQIADIKDRTQRTTTDIRGIYSALLDRLGQETPRIAEQYGNTSKSIADQYATLQQNIQQAYGSANDATAAQVAGMQGGTTQGQTLGAQDQGAYSAIAGIQNQGIQGILATQQAGEQNIQRGQIAYQASEGARDEAGVVKSAEEEQRDILSALTERAAALRAQYGDQDYELGGSYADLDESRFAKLYEGRRSLEDQQAQAIADAEDRAYERDMAERALGIKQYTAETGRYAIDAATSRQNAQLAQAAKIAANKHNLEVQRLRLEQQKLTDPLQKQLIQAKIDKEQASATKALADAQRASRPDPGKQDKYTQAMTVIQNIPGARPDQVNYLQRLVDSAAARADYDKFFITKGNDYMMNELNKSGYQSDATRRYTRQALAILLGVV